ncbi:ABC transporter substrate-binding protein [Erythrobacter sp. Dej080120_24]|uniref:ABC transporter substrate-binding protein n=1 Tax=Erythrobacter sp. Dej080120_24 TaxID=3024837 RepID=UPI0030C6DBC1
MGWRGIRTGVAACALTLAACTPAAPDMRGGEELVPSGPTIVSLNPCLDAILVEIADPSQVLALSHYSRDPAASSIPQGVAQDFGFTGGTAEEVIALSPDLVLASIFIAPATRDALERASLRVETFGSPTSTAESVEQVRALAQAVHREPQGEELATRIEAALAGGEAQSRPVSTLLWQPGEIVAGEATLVAEMLQSRGFQSHAAAMGLGQADHVALETVLADPPELLLVAGDSAGQGHPLLARLEQTRVETVDPRLLFCGGPSVIALGDRLDEIRVRLRP